MRNTVMAVALGLVLASACAHTHVAAPISSCSPSTSDLSPQAPMTTGSFESACNHVVVFSVAWGGDRTARPANQH